MLSRSSRAIVVLCLVGMAALAGAAERRFVWPGGAKAAVSLTYDDALDSQLDTAIPALDKAGLKGSFYLTLASDTLKRRMAEWRVAAAHGHELGNHSLFHQCSRSKADRGWVTAEIDLDKTSAAQMAAQIRLGNMMLHAIDGHLERTFAVPCGDVKAAGEDYLGRIKADFLAIRSGAGDVVPDMASIDPYTVTSPSTANLTGQQLIELARQAAQAGTMAIFTFHGVGGDYLAVSKEAHEELLSYLAANRDVYWADTFVNVMKYVKARRERK